MKTNINYIETTLNGYITKRIKIAEYDSKKDYCGELHFKLDDKDVEYYEEFAGEWDDIDKFISNKSHYGLIGYQDNNHLHTKENVYLEYWKTDSLGWYDDKYVGLEISNKKETIKKEDVSISETEFAG